MNLGAILRGALRAIDLVAGVGEPLAKALGIKSPAVQEAIDGAQVIDAATDAIEAERARQRESRAPPETD